MVVAAKSFGAEDGGELCAPGGFVEAIAADDDLDVGPAVGTADGRDLCAPGGFIEAITAAVKLDFKLNPTDPTEDPEPMLVVEKLSGASPCADVAGLAAVVVVVDSDDVKLSYSQTFENVGPADADADSSGYEFLIHERAEQKAGGDLHAPGGFAGAYIAAVDSDKEVAGGHVHAPGGFVSACVAAESLDKGPADATAEVAGEALRTPGGPVDPNVAANDLDLGPADGAAEFADEALRAPGGLVDDNAVLGSPQPGLDAGGAKETSMAARIPCMPPTRVAGLLLVFLADGAVAEKAYVGFMAFWDLVRKATGDSAGGPRDVIAAAAAAAPMARGKGSSSIPRADSRGPAEGIASWIAGRTKKQILDLVEVACPCLHTAWAAHALSMGHSAALKGKKCEVQRLRSFLSGALDQQIVFDAEGRRCIGIGLKKSCMCSSTTCSLAPCSLTPTTWTPPAPT